MKKVLMIAMALFFVVSSEAQVKQPVSWTFSSRKLSETVYEVVMSAQIGRGWHIYSQTTPDGGPLPTKITFSKNPLLTLNGVVKEVGKMEKKQEPLFGVEVRQFSNSVEFVQTIEMKKPVKTNVSGSVEFMVCNNGECLPPETKTFSVQLN